MDELAGFFSSVKNAAVGVTKVAAKVATAPTKVAAAVLKVPTKVTQSVVSTVAPKGVSNLFNKVTNLPGAVLNTATRLNPVALTAKAVQAVASTPAPQRDQVVDQVEQQTGARSAYATIARGRAPGRGRRGGDGGGGKGGRGGGGGRGERGGGRGERGRGDFFEKIKAAMTSPTAVTTVAAAGGYPATQGQGGGGGYVSAGGDPYADQGGAFDSGPAADESTFDGSLFPEGDPTADMPDELFESREEPEEGDAGDPYGMGEIDYRAALGDLADWKTALKSFGKDTGKMVVSSALTTIGKKLSPQQAAALPPPSPPMSTATKVAIGAAGVGAAYLLFGRRRGQRA